MFGWRPKNLEEARLPSLILSWFFGFGIIQYPLNHLRIGLTLNYLIFVTCIYAISLWYSFVYILEFPCMEREEILYLFVVGSNIILMSINILIGWIHRNSTVQISKQSIALEEILKTLGIPVTCLKRAFFNTLVLIFFWIVTSLGLNLIALLWLHEHTSLIKNIAMIFTFQHPMHVNTSIDLNFSSSIRDMGLRLKCINRILLQNSKVKVNDWILDSYQIPPVIHSYQSKKKIGIAPRFSVHEVHGENFFPNPVHNINKILHIVKYLHLEINIVCNRIMILHGFQLCMTLSIAFTVVTFMCYGMWLNTFNPSSTLHDKILRSIVILGWIIMYILKLSIINITCAKTAAEYKRTGEIIYQIDIQSQDKELTKNIHHFSAQIMQNPLIFSPCGLVQLGYPLIKNFIGSMVTYLVIIIQMGDENINSKH